MGQLITFYSYKGGVGRTMALANVAVLLAQWRHRVLIIDWDLEAPGLEHYFNECLDIETIVQQDGVIDILDGIRDSGRLPRWQDLVIEIDLPNMEGALHLLTAGRRDAEYFNKVRKLDVSALYRERKGGLLIEAMRDEWKRAYDFVLIDSRTGVTDIGGVCTIQLPDILVLLFLATHQSFNGALNVAGKAMKARQKMPVERLKLMSLPIPSKFDSQKEFEISQEWLGLFASDLSELYADWIPDSVKPRTILEVTKIPYIPYFSFGERLPVLEQGTTDPAGLGYAYETLAALLANNLEPVERLVEDRGSFVRLARKKPRRPGVFVSYCHRDQEWIDRLRPHLGVLEKVGNVTIWDDRAIGAGADWYGEIQEAMDQAAVAVCLISADYLASDFVTKEEIPYLLERREKEGMVLIPVLLRPCPWKIISWMTPIQMIPRDGKAIAIDFRDNWDEPFSQVAERVHEIITDPAYRPPAPPPPRWAPPERIDTHRMPATGAELFGRQEEMAILDEAWDSGRTHVVSLVAWGGVGKSTLVNKWLERMAADNYRGARRVFAWSFSSQGTGERATSADQFIAQALDWFGDPDPAAGSPWAKGERLADLVRRERTLLVLDALESLQSGSAYERGKIKDPGLAVLISELGRRNPGICVITTRVAVADLDPFPATARQEDLEQISVEAGRALLRVGGVRGSDAELEEAARDFGNHALALNLLAAYLHGIPGHHVAHADKIPALPKVPQEAGKHPRRVMAAFAARFGDGPELDVLRMLGLFDRPAGADEIAALRAAPPIPGLTAHVQPLSEGAWLRLLERLRETGLVAPRSTHRPDVLDVNPLVREHFGAQLQKDYPNAWRAGNDRLYEHLKAAAPERPDTLEEMMPLFAAVAHGCRAGRHQEALMEVYWGRIQRGNESFNTTKLGAIGSELTALSGFFDPPWRKPVDGITEAAKAFLLNEAGFDLRALGRLAEAAQPMQAALEVALEQEDWENAARGASSLSDLHLTIGDLAQALETARRSVDLADRSGDAFQRMGRHTTLADALHQAGRLDEAEELFREAEAIQEEHQPQFPLLYSLQGYKYCDLLMGQGEASEVLRRAEQTLELVTTQNWLLDIALDHLSLGRAHLLLDLREGTETFSQAATHLNRAVDGLRQAGQQQYIPVGLLARAALHHAQGQFARAQRDLEEALTIATRGGMRLHEADCHLESARLHLARGEEEQARESVSKARAMVEEMGYHRRDGEVAELEGLL